MTLITDTLIFRETLSVPSVVPVNGSQQYSNKYLVIEVTGGQSETTPYPGITLEQIFVNNAQGLIGASLPLRIGKQLIEVMPFGLYKIRLIAGGGIVRANVKIWENTGVLYNYATETPATPDNNAGNITGAEIRSRLVDLVSPNRLPLSAIEGAENLGQNLQVTWENLTGKPTTFPPISHTHLWSQITDKPTFAPVATSGDYNDLINKPAGESGGGREVLTGDRTYFVRTDGNDNNNGLTNTAGGAFATIQKGIETSSKLDLNGYNAKIKIQDFDYSSQGEIKIKAPIGAGSLTIEGNLTTPDYVIIRQISAESIQPLCKIILDGIKISNPPQAEETYRAQACLFLENSTIYIKRVSFAGSWFLVWLIAGSKLIAENGAIITLSKNGNREMYIGLIAQGQSLVNLTAPISPAIVSFSGSPNFSNSIFYAEGLSFINLPGVTLSGAYSGNQYAVGAASNTTIRRPDNSYLSS